MFEISIIIRFFIFFPIIAFFIMQTLIFNTRVFLFFFFSSFSFAKSDSSNKRCLSSEDLFFEKRSIINNGSIRTGMIFYQTHTFITEMHLDKRTKHNQRDRVHTQHDSGAIGSPTLPISSRYVHGPAVKAPSHSGRHRGHALDP